ncbi:non-ribosomal peptide synthetase/MFS transporter [Micromonospora radicis]|uniref:Amino acid adenylation domain-containing protein n=1 Tax=Micromonospora radicis TaxID=1894971 RepID=A0A418MWL0_9ACTN|nr:non-ribosomal peptide synthetase/MFS transporter [Micromonospora radicis]RIV39139.1 amino acid adenylation domain-containing protein [Micromonospora radicis]
MTNLDVPARIRPGSPEVNFRTGQPRLSFGQERIWFTEQLTPGTAAYVVYTTVRLRGPLDVDLLRAALDATAARHDSLRMRFTENADGEPVVQVLPEVRVPVTVSTAATEEAARELVAASVDTPFDLTAAPLLRALLVRTGPDDQLLHLAMHHIVSDGWSLDILLREVAAGYGALRDGGTPPPAPPTGYLDYAAWQRARLDGPAQADAFAYWTGTLAGVPALELPTDRPRPPVQSYAGDTHRFTIDADLTDGLRRLGRAHRSTLYMTLLTGLQAVLFRYTGQRDFAIGSPVAGRVVPELENLVGLFVNTLALRADLSRGEPDDAGTEPGFGALLRRTRTTVVRALAHQETPFERLVAELNVARDVSRTPVFQVLFTLQNYGQGGSRWPTGLRAEGVGTDATTARFDLSLYVGESADGLRGMFVYNTDLFDAATVARLATGLQTLLRAAVAEPDRPVVDLDLLDAGEQARVLALARPESDDTAGVTGTATTLADLIDRHVTATPDAPAVVGDHDTLSYRQLDQRADQLAGWLRRRGIGPDQLVGVLLEQSTELAATLLGVLRAGGAYLPLDPEQPPARLALMLTDARPRIVLTSSDLRDRLPADTVVGCLDEIADELADQPAIRPPATGTGEDLAYVIYTSGSTGTPKGVAVAHRQVLNYLDGVADRFGIVPAARYGLLQSMSFDFSVTVFYLALATGGAVHLLPRRGTGAEIAELLRARRIDYLKITPSHLSALTADADPADLLPARALILGGEASELDRVVPLAAAGTTRVFNHYGPTEATVGVTTYEVTADGPRTGPVPLGRPLPHARVHVLDDRMRPVPVGVPGELYLGGDRLARGYLDRPELTDERFVPDPYGPPGARLYRTGDLARWRADGQLMFLGRRDHQVKIRGYRVELGEIEAALRDFPDVRQAAVLLRDDRLVAYLEPEPDTDAPDLTGLRRALADRLPEHMLPSRWVLLDRLPLQEHGKVDRRALPEPTDEPPTGQRVPPDGPVETLVAGIWQAVLRVPEVGATDDFFELGGHSLLATQVVARLRRELPTVSGAAAPAVSVMDLFRHRTVRELARLVTDGDAATGGLLHELTPPVPAGRRVATLVCVPYGGGSAVVYQPLADALPSGYRLLSVAVPGHDIGLADDPAPIDEVAADVVAEILERVTGPLILYGHCGPGGALAVEVARRLEAVGRELDAVYLGAVFPFGRPAGGPLGPLLRLRLAERLRSDRIYRTWLQAQGTDIGALAPDEARFLIRAMRHDAEVSEEYFTDLMRQSVTPLRAPIISVVGERDRSTDFHEERYKEWHFLGDRTALAVIDEGGHYFLKYRATELAEIVTDVHRQVDAPASTVPEQPVSAVPAQPVPAQPAWQLAAVSHQGPGSPPTSRTGADTAPPPSLRRFALVATGQILSGMGSALTTFAIPLWIYTQTGSLARFALFAVLALLPGLLIAPLAGALVDRFSRRAVLLTACAAAGGGNAALAALVLFDRAEVWHFYPFTAWLSVALAFQRLAFVSAVPQLVPKRFLGHANGLAQTAVGLTQFVVPLAAVALLQAVGLRGILLVDVAFYLFAITVLAVVKFPRTLALQRRESIGAEILAGLRYALRRREFRAMLAFFAALNFFLFPVLFLLSPLVLGFADLNEVAQVALTGGVGAAVGGLVMLVWGGPRHRRMRAVLLGTIGIALAAVLTGLRPNLLLIAAGAFGMYAALAIVNGVYQTIIQTKVPPRVHGRVFALNQMVAQSTLPLGWGLVAPAAARVAEPMMLADGALAGTVGVVLGVGPGRGHGLLYVLFGLCIALTALVSLVAPVLARFDDEVPDAPPDDLVGIEERQARTADAGAPPVPAGRDGGPR